MNRILAGVAFAVAVSLIGAPAHAFVVVLPRAGQVGVGLQGQFGGLARQGELGSEFGTGGGLAVRLKYRMRYDRAMGLSFETRRLDARGARYDQTAFLASEDKLPRTALTLQTFGGDLYQFFGTRSRWQGFLSASAGLAKINASLSDGETVYPIAGDGLYVGAGAGLERFVYRSWAVDASVRYSAVFLDGAANNDLQAALGMIFYAAY